MATVSPPLCTTLAGVHAEVSEPRETQPRADHQGKRRGQESTGDLSRTSRSRCLTIEAEEDPEMMDDTLMNTESSKKIEDGLTHLTASLGEFAQQADLEHAAAEEQQKKRQRKETSGEPVPTGSKPMAMPSMQPFGGAHSG